MITIGVYGDRHLDLRNPRSVHMLQTWDHVINDAVAQGATGFVGLGDVCEGSPDGQATWELGTRYLKAKHAGDVAEVLGNHESPQALRILELLGIEVAWDTIKLVLWPTAHPEVALLLCPFPRRGRPPFDGLDEHGTTIQGSMQAAVERLHGIISAALKSVPHLPLIVFGHWTVQGAKTRDHTFEVHQASEVVFPQHIFDGCALIATGHVHRFGVIREDPPIVVVGSITSQDASEEEEKVYLLVTVDQGKVTWEARPTGARRILSRRIKWVPGMSLDPAILEAARGKEIKLIIDVQSDEAKSFDLSILDELKESAALVTVEKHVIPIQRIRAPKLAEKLSLADQVTEWLAATEQALPADRIERLTMKLDELEQQQTENRV